MNKLSSQYMGMTLKSPLVASASPMTSTLKSALELEEAGISAIVMRSLFEEHCKKDHEMAHQMLHDQDIGHAEANSSIAPPILQKLKTTEDHYLETLQSMKKELSIPVIASLNGASLEGWEEHAANIQQAGADALELNIYSIAANLKESADQVEHRYTEIVRRVRETVDLPLAVKISSQFSSPVHFIEKLKMAGADAVVIFNRFYQPDINLQTLDVDNKIQLSDSSDLLERLRWTAILKHQVAIDIAITGGVHSAEGVLKASLVGSNITQLCSVLLLRGPDIITELNHDIERWLDANEYESLEQLRGSMSYSNNSDPSSNERSNYMDMLDSWGR
ncbi:dihydroorotate dehydrogenase-like protein [Neptunomonas sp.]|uniref:dihydroorotate dehydrogenase-like protein n=1 Tax=Neptunomonas sp. TaxID=1971898 RepID=UPI0025D046CD|nr:dihydroorotate dehydrogenase-like protein [Neptunomonas sp.]